MKINLFVGIDDTDSALKGGCTTYIAAVLVEKLSRYAVFNDYPHLIRLNPITPYKTRGNGAISLNLSLNLSKIDVVRNLVIDTVRAYAHPEDPNTHPGIVFWEFREQQLSLLSSFAKQSLHELVDLDTAYNIVRKINAEIYTIKKGRGIIGALSAIGLPLTSDYTFELIAYRPYNSTTPRLIEFSSVLLMDTITKPYTYNNLDYETKRILITPHGPDPVYFGIRGETPQTVYTAFKLVQPMKPIERWVIFRTNQGTDMHLIPKKISDIKPYSCGILTGIVKTYPKVLRGGHVILTIEDSTGHLECAVYYPTGNLRKIASKLAPGDEIQVFGCAKPLKERLTFNVEKLRILKLAPRYIQRNPTCPVCGHRMTSAGKNKGFKCKKCSFVDPHAKKILIPINADIHPGLYMPPPRSQKHLSKPLSRPKLEKKIYLDKMLNIQWHYP